LHYLDHSFSTPAHNLACDEALLDLCEEGAVDELLRFWEPQQYFVVLGSSNKVREETYVERCKADDIPILRRHSGGGTVLQGPGCLNYSLVLRIAPEGSTRNITDTTSSIMRRHAEVLSKLLGERVEMNGSSDLTIAGRKFSGNAQRRKIKSLLFHGTFLLDFDLQRIERYLRMPPKQPQYREQRGHLDFVRNISIRSSFLKEALRNTWLATQSGIVVPQERIELLVNAKYLNDEWNKKL
jgi:lipoate-protein ligase A